MKGRESNTRLIINKLLREAGWILYGDKGKPNVDTELPDKSLQSDYVLLDKNDYPLCILEAKKKDYEPLNAKEKARKYALSLRCRFVILSNGFKHYFWDIDNGNPRLISAFPSQNQLELRKLKFNPIRDKEEKIDLDYIAQTQFPDFQKNPDYVDIAKREEFLRSNEIRLLRDYQLRAVKKVKNAVMLGNERFLLEMATGTGKTLTSSAIIKMFLRLFGVKRVLFLVDRIELESQAYKEFNAVLKNDFSISIWKENKSQWIKSEIVISTVQSFTRNDKYRRIFSPDNFDLVISDEAHRSLGRRSKKVFEYFVGFKLGLTATPRDYLKSIDIDNLSIKDPLQLDRRFLLDTYITFGCENSEPTFRYSLIDGVREGYLVNPKVFDARTEISTKLLSDEGYSVEWVSDDGNEEEITLFQKDFEKKFYSENTNRNFCEVFLKNALHDPFNNEIGKTLIFCVSQKHALKITTLLNEYAEKIYPEKYNSDFAVQITSDVDDNTQQMTVDFRNNVLSGRSKTNPFYLTSKTRVCVTVGMMTTGYDCEDLLNICLMRPIFSPSEFIQMKGRGTRKCNFRDYWMKDSVIPSLNQKKFEKDQFFLFDFFGNYEFFEEKFNYDEIIDLPSNSGRGSTTGGGGVNIDEIESFIPDPLKDLKETLISENCMRVDRDIYRSFKKTILENQEIKDLIEEDDFISAEEFIKTKLINSPNSKYSLENIAKSIGLDRRPLVSELLYYSLDLLDYLPNKRECLDNEFDIFNKISQKSYDFYSDAKQVFEAYACDEEFRRIIESKKYAELSTHPSGTAFKNLPLEFKEEIPNYLKKNVDLEKFINVR